MSEVIAELKALKLYGMAHSYAELLQHGGTAAMQASHWLIEHLLAAERTDRALRTIRYQMHTARFPVHRDLASFDFGAAKVNQATINQLATLAFTETAHNVVMIGRHGHRQDPSGHRAGRVRHPAAWQAACAFTRPWNWSTRWNRRRRPAGKGGWLTP